MAEHGIGDEHAHDDDLTRAKAWCLYLSHFLSMWNSRTYEYAAILFIQAAFPGNLLPSAINGIAETVCVIVSSSAMGRWVDGAPTRLRPLLLTIFANRTTLVACCIMWLLLFSTPDETLRRVLFAAILALGMVEKASRMANILSMERDWVPTLANADGEDYSLTHMNTVMRRIDITCKFLAPPAISGVVALLDSVPAAMVIAIVSFTSLVPEYWAAMRVWKNNGRLRGAKKDKRSSSGDLELDRYCQPESHTHPSDVHVLQRLLAKGEEALRIARSITRDHIEGLSYYFSTTVWLPSICAAVLHASVLAWSGTLITWLLNANYTLAEITVAKGVGSVFEIGSTVVFPWAVNMFSTTCSDALATASYQMIERRSVDDEGESEDEVYDCQAQGPPNKLRGDVTKESQFIGSRNLHVGVVKAALWALSGLLIFLVPTIIALFYLNSRLVDAHPAVDDTTTSPLPTYTLFTVVFFTFLSFSFLGRWMYDLAVMQLTQMLIPAAHRSSFGGVEQALVSCVSLVHWVAAAIWHQQGDFVWLALGSFCAIAAATAAFTWWARRWTRDAVVYSTSARSS
ncbi:uncharacterized protein Z520_10147 [Fonsecaea multimorphosa CBS 102226]|uniref:Solute carrier family 40 member n=1 Tax=Fonsecaea multimorphosa CBS 102226 TaxID=1442371 RepID=A0A0D2IAE2_9EURO|nr:uncharacterized protein Z520_10147 [Fonsecaea multimorphosa CBS 102226]KIX94121.1 hypothetical protein Z520_10147 [Fonsecaea multimorphosa CBS 102226]OAL19474.1 hypothetical protein AYO22_09636 [Fonsecaea multimorphosa]